MFCFSKPAGVLLLITALSVSLAAQSMPREQSSGEKLPAPGAGTEGAGHDEFLPREQQRARWLLDELFDEAKGFDDESLKVRVQAQIADLLWPYDEPRARHQFEEVLRATEAIKPELQGNGSEPRLPPEFGLQSQLRSEVLEVIARRDADWAKKLGGSVAIPWEDTADSVGLNRGDGDKPAPPSEQNPRSFAGGGPQTTTQVPGGNLSRPFKPTFPLKSVRPAGTQDLLGQAEKAGSLTEKDNLYIRAVLSAMSESDFGQALSIVKKISHEPSRSNFDSMARYRAAMAALSQEDFDAAARYAKDLPNLPQRASLCSQIARLFQTKKDIVRVAEILDDAERSLGGADDGPDKAHALLIITGAAAQFDPLRGFEFMRSAVEAIITRKSAAGRLARPSRPASN